MSTEITCADISDSSPRVWELACIYEDRGFSREEMAEASALSRKDRILLREEMDDADAKWRRTQPEPVAKAPVLRNYDHKAAYYHDRILARDERDCSWWT